MPVANTDYSQTSLSLQDPVARTIGQFLNVVAVRCANSLSCDSHQLVHVEGAMATLQLKLFVAEETTTRKVEEFVVNVEC